ncbi:hypothetical protein Ssi03_29220 [Sphaerisporangium siamense]|uniref:Uncharacterized protein n=1 Tax=Sphaerisporangium siamense TaxID=795645 RepID=A0A7W7DD43_9ACTN|nr:hypothetical protein [Sphaerisporangium siamense]MBB4704386.1 hypothetical protein [Sphaerisporangium siamense]GII84932.1 hypothetical protein Ssi03_29220 [Sphaerisporangium siamense]
MTDFSEKDLRDVLADRSSRSGGRSVPVDDIVRAGARLRRRRRLTVAAAFAAVSVSIGGVVAVAPGVAVLPESPVAGRPAFAPAWDAGLPDRWTTETGAKPLIHSERATVPGGRVVRFVPTSTETVLVMHCSDPRAWVMTATTRYAWTEEELRALGRGTASPAPLERDGKTGSRAERGASLEIGRCGGPQGDYVEWRYDVLSAGLDWKGKEQSVQVWVFPSEISIRAVESGSSVGGKCSGAGSPPRACDGSYLIDVGSPGRSADSLVDELGPSTETWLVGVYDGKAPAMSAG